MSKSSFYEVAGSIMFSGCPSVRTYVSWSRYLKNGLMDSRQTLVMCVSWRANELIRFGDHDHDHKLYYLTNDLTLFIFTAQPVNGETNGEGGEEAPAAPVPAPGPKKQDIIMITGKKDNCDKAKEALLVREFRSNISFS